MAVVDNRDALIRIYRDRIRNLEQESIVRAVELTAEQNSTHLKLYSRCNDRTWIALLRHSTHRVHRITDYYL